MPSKLKERCKALQIEDWDWYLEAYQRCCARLETEERRGNSKNLDLLQRRLQALYDKCVSLMEEERARERQARAVAIAINHAVTDHGLPRSLLKAYEKPKASA